MPSENLKYVHSVIPQKHRLQNLDKIVQLIYLLPESLNKYSLIKKIITATKIA